MRHGTMGRPLSCNHTVMPSWPKQRSYHTHHVLWRLHGQTDRHQVHIRNCWKGTKLCHLQTNERITGDRTTGHIEAVQTIITTPLIRQSTKAAPNQASLEVRKGAPNRGDFPHMQPPSTDKGQTAPTNLCDVRIASQEPIPESHLPSWSQGWQQTVPTADQ